MNANRKVLLFVVYATGLYLLASFFANIFHWKSQSVKRIDLIADIIKKQKEEKNNQVDSLDVKDIASINMASRVNNKGNANFYLYRTPHLITNFSIDTNEAALAGFLRKLYDLKNGKKKKVRIAYFGDSMIEGDLLTQTLRKLLQQMFGGSGVGFVPITSQVSQFRTTVTDNYSDGWQDENFKTEGDKSHLFISGHLFRGNGDWVQMKDQTITDTSALIEKNLLCGFSSQPVTINVNNRPFIVHAIDNFNRISIVNDKNKSIKLSVSDQRLPLYGISFESGSGVFVDNLSFRGITGIEFSKIDSSFLVSIAQHNSYDLIIFQYGVNLLFRPYDKNFYWYARALRPVVRKFKNCFPKTDFLLISTADRAFRYADEYQSATGIDSLIKVQALLAYETGSSFYNLFATMGGTNSIVDWTARKPSLANKDYIHPNHRGADILGKYFFEAIMNDYKKFTWGLKK